MKFEIKSSTSHEIVFCCWKTWNISSNFVFLLASFFMRITLYAIPVLRTTSPRNPDQQRQKWPKTAGKWAKNRHHTKTRCYCWGWVSTLGKLSNQAGSGAGGGLYSTPTTTDKQTTESQDDNPEKFGGNCTPGTKLLSNHKNSFRLDAMFPLSWSKGCSIVCCEGNQAGFQLKGWCSLCMCDWVWLKAINHFSLWPRLTCSGCLCLSKKYSSPNLGRHSHTSIPGSSKQVVDINIYKMDKRRQLSFTWSLDF